MMMMMMMKIGKNNFNRKCINTVHVCKLTIIGEFYCCTAYIMYILESFSPRARLLVGLGYCIRHKSSNSFQRELKATVVVDASSQVEILFLAALMLSRLIRS